MNGCKALVSVAVALALPSLATGLGAVRAQEAGPASTAGTPLTTGFIYQGQLIKDGAPVNGTCDLLFLPGRHQQPGQGLRIRSDREGPRR